MTEIVYLETRAILAHYIPALDRIELSSFLLEFPELHNFAKEHEKRHSELKSYSLGNIWIDIRDRAKFYWNRKLWQQYKAFLRPMRPKDWKTRLFMILYSYSHFIQVLEMLIILPARSLDYVWSKLKK